MRWLWGRRAGAIGGAMLIASVFLPSVFFWMPCPPNALSCLGKTALWWPEFTKDVVSYSQGGSASSSYWFLWSWLAGAVVLSWVLVVPHLRGRLRPIAYVLGMIAAAGAAASAVIAVWQLVWLLGFWIQPPAPLGYGYQNWAPGPGLVLEIIGAVLVVFSVVGDLSGRSARSVVTEPAGSDSDSAQFVRAF